jgi:hypothetical protein
MLKERAEECGTNGGDGGTERTTPCDAQTAPVLHLFVGPQQVAATVEHLTLDAFLRRVPDSFPLPLASLRSLVPAAARRVAVLSTRDGAHDVSIWGERVELDQDDVPTRGHVLEVDDVVVWTSEATAPT